MSNSSDSGGPGSPIDVSIERATVQGPTLAQTDDLETVVDRPMRIVPGGIQIDYAFVGREARKKGDAYLNTFLRDEIPDDLIVEREDVLSTLYQLVPDEYLLEFCRNLSLRPLQEDSLGLQALVVAYSDNSHILFKVFGDDVIEQTAKHGTTIAMYNRFFETTSETNTAIRDSAQLFDCGERNLYQIVYNSGLANKSEALAALSRLNKIATENSPEAVAKNIQTYVALAEISREETATVYGAIPLKLIEEHADEVIALATRYDPSQDSAVGFRNELHGQFTRYFPGLRGSSTSSRDGTEFAVFPAAKEAGEYQVPAELQQPGEFQPDMNVRAYGVLKQPTGLQRVGRALAAPFKALYQLARPGK